MVLQHKLDEMNGLWSKLLWQQKVSKQVSKCDESNSRACDIGAVTAAST